MNFTEIFDTSKTTMSSLLFHLLVSDLTLTGVHETIVPILFDPTILYSQMGIIIT